MTDKLGLRFVTNNGDLRSRADSRTGGKKELWVLSESFTSGLRERGMDTATKTLIIRECNEELVGVDLSAGELARTSVPNSAKKDTGTKMRHEPAPATLYAN